MILEAKMVGLSKNYAKTLEFEELTCCSVESAEKLALHNREKIFNIKKALILLELHGEKAFEAVGIFLEKYNYHTVLVWDIPTPKIVYKNLKFIPHMILCKSSQ